MICCAIRCLAKFGIHLSRTLGSDGRLRFHPYSPISLVNGDVMQRKSFYFTWNHLAVGNPKVLLYNTFSDNSVLGFHIQGVPKKYFATLPCETYMLQKRRLPIYYKVILLFCKYKSGKYNQNMLTLCNS